MSNRVFGPYTASSACAASAWALVGALALPASATTPISGALNVVANSTLAGHTVTDQHSTSWAAVPTSLADSALATATAGADSVQTTGGLIAMWKSADTGIMFLRGYGWFFNVTDPANAPVASNLTQGRGGDDWTYTFKATHNGQFNLAYNVAFTGNPFALWGWVIDWNGPGGGLNVTNPSDPTAHGFFMRPITAGQTYTIGLNGNPNISFKGPPGVYLGQMDGDFSWIITGSGVPESDAWSLMIAGLSLAGAALRRRRAFAAS